MGLFKHFLNNLKVSIDNLTASTSPPTSSSSIISGHRFNMELDLHSLFGLHPCAQVYSLAESWDPPPSPCIWAHSRGGRYQSAKIDDISLWPPCLRTSKHYYGLSNTVTSHNGLHTHSRVKHRLERYRYIVEAIVLPTQFVGLLRNSYMYLYAKNCSYEAIITYKKCAMKGHKQFLGL